MRRRTRECTAPAVCGANVGLQGSEICPRSVRGPLVAAIAAIILLVVFALGGYVQGAFQDTCTALEGGGVNTSGNNC